MEEELTMSLGLSLEIITSADCFCNIANGLVSLRDEPGCRVLQLLCNPYGGRRTGYHFVETPIDPG